MPEPGPPEEGRLCDTPVDGPRLLASAGLRVLLVLTYRPSDLALGQHDALNDAVMTAMVYLQLIDLRERGVRLARRRSRKATLRADLGDGLVVAGGQEKIREMFTLGVNFVLYKPLSHERAMSTLLAEAIQAGSTGEVAVANADLSRDRCAALNRLGRDQRPQLPRSGRCRDH